MRPRFCFLLSALLSCSSSAWSAPIIHAVQDAWPPYIIDTSDYPGISVEIAQQAYASQGYQLELDIKPWSRALKEIQHGRDQIVIAAWYSAQREPQLRFSDPYLYTEIHLIARKDQQVYFGNFEDLKDKTVGIVENYAYDDDFMASPWFKRVPSSDLLSSIRKVHTGRVDLFIEDERVARWTMAENNIPPEDFNYIQPPVSLSPLYIMVARDNPNAQAYLDAFNRGLKTIQASGAYLAILHKYDTDVPNKKKPAH
ncbi:substrate-binding periplasmic protein [Vibrio furnissii]|uniref:substrate-binding periplasmic protein n=1 Tax=Vibrio furnissii TaxID=29494 RepID=UPI001EECAC79|nr:transporter substrate-binding domain-containing protein [Vibrio furnissii]